MCIFFFNEIKIVIDFILFKIFFNFVENFEFLDSTEIKSN